MNRIIYAPQYPTHLRYSEWFFTEIPKQLSKHFEVIILGNKFFTTINNNLRGDLEMFSPINESIEFEINQIKEFLDLKLMKNDILFHGDISFPGLFSNILYHKRPSRCYAICHATSKNAYDYFEPLRESKWEVETGHSKLFKKIFVATQYHKEFLGWENTVVTALPEHLYERYNELKLFDIISVSRPSPQKVDSNLESIIENEFNTKIVRNSFDSWEQYYKFLSKSKCLFISSSAETFGYQVLDAVYNNCVPLSPRNFSYPELLSDEYLYSSIDEAIDKVRKVLEGKLIVPKILCQEQIDKFYENIVKKMLE